MHRLQIGFWFEITSEQVEFQYICWTTDTYHLVVVQISIYMNLSKSLSNQPIKTKDNFSKKECTQWGLFPFEQHQIKGISCRTFNDFIFFSCKKRQLAGLSQPVHTTDAALGSLLCRDRFIQLVFFVVVLLSLIFFLWQICSDFVWPLLFLSGGISLSHIYTSECVHQQHPIRKQRKERVPHVTPVKPNLGCLHFGVCTN